MKDIFNTKRIIALARLGYQENWRHYLLILMLAAIVAWLILSSGNPVMIESRSITTNTFEKYETTGVIEHRGYQKQQYLAFWLGWVVIAVGIGFYELRKYNRKESNTRAFLIPVSNTERFTLALFNTIIVSGVVWLCLFYATNWLVANYKYVFWISNESANNRFFLFWDPIAVHYSKIDVNIRPAFANVFDLTPVIKNNATEHILSWFLCGILWIQSLYMLGSLVFKRQAPLLILLAQLLIFFIIGYISYSIIRGFDAIITEHSTVVIATQQLDLVVHTKAPYDQPNEYLIWIMISFPVCYFWAAFQTFRNKQI